MLSFSLSSMFVIAFLPQWFVGFLVEAAFVGLLAIILAPLGVWLDKLIDANRIRSLEIDVNIKQRQLDALIKEKCAPLERELRLLKEAQDRNTAKFYQVNQNIDKIRKERMQLEDLVNDAKARLKGMRMRNEAAARQIINQEREKIKQTGKSRVGIIIALIIAVLPKIIELISSYIELLGKQSQLESQARQYSCSGKNSAQMVPEILNIIENNID